MTRAEKAFIAFSGLKGAVPILLAAFAVLGDAPDAQRIYGLVFVAVLVSVVAQGSLVPSVARRLGIPMRLQDRLPWELSVRVGQEPTGAREYRVAANSRADGTALGDLPLGDDRLGDAARPRRRRAATRRPDAAPRRRSAADPGRGPRAFRPAAFLVRLIARG